MKNNEKGRTFIISIDNMIEESVLIWMEVKNAAPSIIKAGGNPIEVIIKRRWTDHFSTLLHH